MLEAPIRAEFAEGAIILSGKVDLSLGRPLGTTAGKVIVDFKTGNFYSSHRGFAFLCASRSNWCTSNGARTIWTALSSPANTSPRMFGICLFRVEDGVEKIANILFKGTEPKMCLSEWCALCAQIRNV